MSFAPGPPLTATAVRLVLLGSGELGRSEDEVSDAVAALGTPCVIKPVMSSWGKGQWVIRAAGEVGRARRPCTSRPRSATRRRSPAWPKRWRSIRASTFACSPSPTRPNRRMAVATLARGEDAGAARQVGRAAAACLRVD